MEMKRITVWSNTGASLGDIAPGDVFECRRIEETNGEHALSITTTRRLEKPQRLLLQSYTGKWYEYVVSGVDEAHQAGNRPFGTYHCVWSLQHDLACTPVSAMPGVQNPVTAAYALGAALGSTQRWAVGTVTQQTTGGASMYQMSAWEALSVLVEVWGGEIDATITVGDSGVTARAVDLYAAQGDATAKRRFEFSYDMPGIRRVVADTPPACRIIPRGKGEETASGGYGRRITIESVNGGLDYLENADMVDLVKLPNGSGGWEYPTVYADNDAMETPAALKAWGISVLEDYTVPKVSYEADVLQFAQAGLDARGLQLGDAVHCIDKTFYNGLRLEGRVQRIEVDEINQTNIAVTIGNLERGMAGWLGELSSGMAQVTETVRAMNGGNLKTASYLERLLTRLNGEINATGGWTYIVPGDGIRTYDAEVTDPAVGTEANQVVEVKGGTIRIANSRTSQGEWEWKTVLVSGLIAAEVLSADNITTGALRVEDASHQAVFVADIDAGTVQIAGDAIQIGQKSLPQILADGNTVFGSMQQAGAQQVFDATMQQFEPTDDTKLRLIWEQADKTFASGTTWIININESRFPANYGRYVRISSPYTTFTEDDVVVLGVYHHDPANPDRWMWQVESVEAATTSDEKSSRALFARDTSSVEINAGTVTFNSDTFVVNSTNFQVTQTGVINAVAGTIGGFNLGANKIFNSAVELAADGLWFTSEGQDIGGLWPQVSTTSVGNSLLAMRFPGEFLLWTKIPGSSDNAVKSLQFLYSGASGDKGAFIVDSDVWLKGSLQVGNTRIDESIEDSISAAVILATPGGNRWQLDFENGLLTGSRQV